LKLGIRVLKTDNNIEIKIPNKKLVKALEILNIHKRISKKEFAKLVDNAKLITIKAQKKNYEKVRFGMLDKNIIKPLEEWNFVKDEKIGRQYWISITDKGIDAIKFLV